MHQLQDSKSIYIASIANGLGDLIVCLPAIQWLIATGIPTHLVIRSPEQAGLAERIHGLAGTIHETELQPDSLASGATYINMRSHPLQTDHIWGSAEFEGSYPGYKITDVLKGICQDWQIAADYERLQPLPVQTVDACRDKILLVPGSAGRVKYWPASRWSELQARLSADGLECVIIGQPDKSDIVAELLAASADSADGPGARHFATPALTDALDAISSARAVVAIDTGLMHMALHQGVPTVALFRDNTMFMRPYSHCRSVVAPACDARCVAVEFGAAPNKMVSYDRGNESYVYWQTWGCLVEDAQKRCMAQISVDQVYGAVRELLEL